MFLLGTNNYITAGSEYINITETHTYKKNSKISLINMLGPQKGNKQIPKRNLLKYKEMGKWIEIKVFKT